MARPNSLAEIAERIRAASGPDGMTTKIVAVDGPGAAGKTTFAARLARELGGVQVVSTDDFASWDEPLEWWPRLLEGALEPLSRNEIGRYRRTDWDRTGVEAWGEVRPAEFVILEGVSASRQAFRPYVAYSIWVETARDLRLRRGLERDGGNARAQWERWMAQEDDYVELERPQERADLVVRGDQEL